jgi:hypothetical protein
MTTWPGRLGPHVGEGKRIGCTGLGFLLDGPRAISPAGPNGFPGPFLYIFFSSFSFSVFLFLLYLLQKCFKSIQTKF